MVYLVGQVRTGNRLARSESVRATTQTSDQLAIAIAHDRGLAELWTAGLSDSHALDETDRVRFTWLMSCLITALYRGHNDHRLGLLPDSDLFDNREGNRAVLASPGGRWWWERRKGAYRASFIEFIEREILSEGCRLL